MDSPTSPAALPPPSLLQLPTEVRTEIFSQYFSTLEFELLSKRNTNSSKKSIPLCCRSNARSNTALAILLVSRQLRNEALPHLSRASFIITALFPGWHQASCDTLGISPVHATRIRELELRFLNSNFAILPALPNLERVFICPPGELRCRRWSHGLEPIESQCWSMDEIDGERGWSEMKNELRRSMKLMHDLIDSRVGVGQGGMRFEVRFSVGFKFLIKPLHWSHSGRLLSTRGDFYSVHCIAVGWFDSGLGFERDVVDIESVRPILD